MRKGIKQVSGDLVLDDSYFALEPEDPGGFDGQRYRTYNALPTPCSTNFNAVDFIFRTDGSAGRVVIRTDPVLPNLSCRQQGAARPRASAAAPSIIAMHADNDGARRRP